jgi:phage anti-repressor protein/phage antirepressor YoqD-like protein
MSDIIPILARAIGEEEHSVDARELHAKLEVGRDFSNWIKSRIDGLGLVQGVDYEKFNDLASPVLASANRIDYALTLDAAKHVAMAERNERGRQIRGYFIAAERRLREAQSPVAALNDPAALRGLLLDYTGRLLAAEATIAEQAPKVDFHDAVLAAGDTLGFREAVKVLKRSTAATEAEVRTILMTKRIVQRLGKKMLPTYIGGEQRGYVTSRITTWVDATGVTHSDPELRITPKGIDWLLRQLRERAPATGDEAA